MVSITTTLSFAGLMACDVGVAVLSHNRYTLTLVTRRADRITLGSEILFVRDKTIYFGVCDAEGTFDGILLLNTAIAEVGVVRPDISRFFFKVS